MRTFFVLASLLVISTLCSWADLAGWASHSVPVQHVRPDQGHALVADLGEPGLSDEQRQAAQLFLVDSQNGTFVRNFEPMLGSSWLYQRLAILLDYAFPDRTYETRKMLGPGSSPLYVVRQQGGGAVSGLG